MTPATAGSIVLGALCAAALILMLLGVVHVMRALRQLKNALKRVEATQSRALDPQHVNMALEHLARDAESAKELLERGRRALSTIGVALRYCVVAVRVVKLLT
jgi:hypothetical protein